ncbi:MAG: prepilin-type N-terminal cleavage/methylation domain-containing protein [Thermodesulfobacteriota bacterium]
MLYHACQSRGEGTAADRGRTLFETLIALVIIGILLIGAITYYQRATRVIREYAVISELENIRTSILLYFVLNKRYPKSLKEMMSEKIILPFHDTNSVKGITGAQNELPPQTGAIIIDRTYLEKISLDAEGNLIDPFGNPYVYDSKLGKIRSSTEGYRSW